MSGDTVAILVEDDSDHTTLTRRAFEKAGVRCNLVILPDGKQASDYFESPTTVIPVLILLDLNLPGVPGIFLLKKLPETRMKDCPVIVLTGSANAQDITEGLGLGVKAYIQKDDLFRDATVLRQTLIQIGLERILEGA